MRDCDLDNARQVPKLADMLSLSYFVQAQIFPYSYQNVIMRGNATKIDALLTARLSGAGRHSVPLPGPPIALRAATPRCGGWAWRIRWRIATSPRCIRL